MNTNLYNLILDSIATEATKYKFVTRKFHSQNYLPYAFIYREDKINESPFMMDFSDGSIIIRKPSGTELFHNCCTLSLSDPELLTKLITYIITNLEG